MEIEPGIYIVRRKCTAEDGSIRVNYYHVSVSNYAGLKKDIETYKHWAEVDGCKNIELTYRFQQVSKEFNWSI